jgi:hypothetical protein
MTAVFAVWNNYGFSLASDSNQTSEMYDQNWVDPVEKAFMLENHQIAIAGAGASFHQGVEVNEIFRTWELTLSEEGFSTLEEYLVDFANWFSEQKFASNGSSIESLRGDLEFWFTDLRDIFLEHGESITTSFLEDIFYAKHASVRTYLNLFGNAWETLAKDDDSSTDIVSKKYLKIQEIRDRLVACNPLLKEDLKFNFEQDGLLEHETSDAVKLEFSEVFGRAFDDSSELDLKILELTINMIENTTLDEDQIEILMIGYGRKDWLPSSFQFNIQPKFFGIPRLFFSNYSNPNYNWYVTIAIDTAVYELTRGISRERRGEVDELVLKYLDESSREQFANELDEKLNEKFQSTLSKIEHLTIERLEFVSRLFVQIEALKSFLDQPIAGVGGDTKVISMTKNSRRERNFKEFQ